MKTLTILTLALSLLCLALPIAFELHLMAVPVQPPVWPPQPPAPLVPIPNNVIISNRIYTASANEAAMQKVWTYGTVMIADTINVTFESGKQVLLMPGFHAVVGSHFRAQIGLSTANLARPTETEGIPAGLLVDANHNGIPDLIEVKLGLDPAKPNNADTIININDVNVRLGDLRQQYGYDNNGQLKISSERTYNLDPEGNITGSDQ